MIFMHDGAGPNFAFDVREYINKSMSAGLTEAVELPRRLCHQTLRHMRVYVNELREWVF